MNYFIVIINILSAIIILLSTIIVFTRFHKTKTQYKFLLGFAFSILLLGSIINILEYSTLLKNTEEFEQILSILFLPILIFAIYESIIQEELQKSVISEQKFKGIFNQSFSFIGLLDSDGMTLEANYSACEFIGYKNDDFKGVLFSETKWWDHSENEKQKLTDAIEQAKNGKTVRFESTYKDLNQNIHYIDFSIKPITDDQGKVIFLIPEGREITEIKLARLELEQHKKNLKQLVFQRTKELESANEELHAINDEINEKGKIINDQNEELKTTLLNLKKTQAQLLQAEKMASLGTLTSGVAHEINNPLNYIMGAYVGLNNYFKEHGSFNGEKTSLFLRGIKEGLERTTAIVNGLNQFSGNSRKFDEKCNMHSILDNCLLIINSELKNSIIVTKSYHGKQLSTKGNTGMLHQAFINIFTNARQSIHGKGEISITTNIENDYILIIIKDSGIGIKKDIINQITDPFFTTKSPGEGTGLGLSIAYSIIKDHNGSIDFESEINEGTSVIVKLPKLLP